MELARHEYCGSPRPSAPPLCPPSHYLPPAPPALILPCVSHDVTDRPTGPAPVHVLTLFLTPFSFSLRPIWQRDAGGSRGGARAVLTRTRARHLSGAAPPQWPAGEHGRSAQGRPGASGNNNAHFRGVYCMHWLCVVVSYLVHSSRRYYPAFTPKHTLSTPNFIIVLTPPPHRCSCSPCAFWFRVVFEQVPMDLWQDLASRSRVTARKSDEEAARFRERVGEVHYRGRGSGRHVRRAGAGGVNAVPPDALSFSLFAWFGFVRVHFVLKRCSLLFPVCLEGDRKVPCGRVEG